VLVLAGVGAAGDCQALPLWPLPSQCSFSDLYSLVRFSPPEMFRKHMNI
jgi:hypothetical protein